MASICLQEPGQKEIVKMLGGLLLQILVVKANIYLWTLFLFFASLCPLKIILDLSVITLATSNRDFLQQFLIQY